MSIKILTVFTLFLQLSALAQENAASADPFTSNKPAEPRPFVTEMKVTVEKQKVLINWKAGDNQAINLFEVEKSTDGRTFSTAALVFGTDKEAADSYQYFEKNTGKKITYRIKLIGKDKQVVYSEPVTTG